MPILYGSIPQHTSIFFVAEHGPVQYRLSVCFARCFYSRREQKGMENGCEHGAL